MNFEVRGLFGKANDNWVKNDDGHRGGSELKVVIVTETVTDIDTFGSQLFENELKKIT